MTKLLLHESKRRVGSPGVFITPGTYFIKFHFIPLWPGTFENAAHYFALRVTNKLGEESDKRVK